MATASGSVGMSGRRMSRTLDGKCVKTIVFTRPNRSASRAADSADTAASRFAAKKMEPSDRRVDSELLVEPEGEEALRDEPAREGIQREEGRQLEDHALRAVQPEATTMPSSGCSAAGGTSIAGPRRNAPIAISAPTTA